MSSRQYSILVVEDSEEDREQYRRILARVKEPQYRILETDSVEMGLKICRDEKPDCVLLDYHLPGLDGLEFLAGMSDPVQLDLIPVVMLTGQGNQAVAVQAMKSGAQDYLVKEAMTGKKLRRAIHTAMAKMALRRKARQRRRDLEQLYLTERDRRSHLEGVVHETEVKLQVAREIQEQLFPSSPPKLPGLDIAGGMFPSESTGGDYYDFIPMRENTLGVVIGDASGHGMGPALVMASARAYLRALAQSYSDVGTILTTANRLLSDDSSSGRFVTLLLARIDPATRTMVYAAAAHEGYLLNSAGDLEARLESTGLPLGMYRSEFVSAAPARQLQPGQILLLLTDGIAEAVSPSGERFGMQNALKVVQAHRQLAARVIVQKLHESACQFSQPKGQHDDMSVVVIKVQA